MLSYCFCVMCFLLSPRIFYVNRNRNSKFFDEIEIDELFFSETYYVRMEIIICYEFSILTFLVVEPNEIFV